MWHSAEHTVSLQYALFLHLLFSCQVVPDSLRPPWTAAHQVSLSLTISRSLPEFRSIESVMLSTHLILCAPLLLLPSIFPSSRFFSIVSALHIRRPKYWSFSISPPNEYSALISFRIDSFGLLTVCGHLNLDCTHQTWPLDVAQFTPLNGFSTAAPGSMGKWIQQKRLLPPRKVWETQTKDVL